MLLIYLPFLLFIAVRLYQCALKYRRLLSVSEGIFTPPALPLIGHIHLLPKCRYDWMDFFIEHSNNALRQGSSLIRWRIFSDICIWTVDAESSRVILENSVELQKGRDYAFFLQWLGEGLLLSGGAKWKRQRRMLTPTFHFSMLEQYMNIFNRHARALSEKMASLEGFEQVVDCEEMLTRCSLAIIGEAAMGVQLDGDDSGEYVRAVSEFNSIAHAYTTNPFFSLFPPIWWLFGSAWATRKCVRTLKTFTHKVIEDRIRKRQELANQDQAVKRDGKGKAFLDLLLEQEGEERLSQEELREQVDTFMFAAHALLWTLWCLASHPECQQRVHSELVEHFGEAAEEELELDSNAVNELRYLDRCIREALRLFPPVPVVERDLQNDVHIGDKALPKGSMVLVSPMVLHHNEKVYTTAHWDFNPDNFLPETVAQRNTFDYIPFSAGPRNFIGQKFAQLEVKVVLVHILRRFRLSTNVPFRANRPAMEAILRPERGLPLYVHYRRAN